MKHNFCWCGGISAAGGNHLVSPILPIPCLARAKPECLGLLQKLSGLVSKGTHRKVQEQTSVFSKED